MKRNAIDEIVEQITERTHPEEWNQYQREQLEQRKQYALKMLDLQEKAGLTYKEARVFLNKRSIKMLNHLAMEWGITIEGVYNLSRRASKKLENAGLDEKDIICQIHGFID